MTEMAAKTETIGPVTFRPFPHENDCSICYEPMETGTRSALHTICGNSWHDDCFLAWATRKKSGTCPNCRADICQYRSELWWRLVFKIEDIVQLDHGIWTHGSKGYHRSKVPELNRPFRPLKIDQSSARHLASGCRIPLLHKGYSRTILPRYLDKAFLREKEIAGLGHSQVDWLQEWARLATADAVIQSDMTKDIGWRILVYRETGVYVECLVRVKPERRKDEASAWCAYRKWQCLDFCDRILTRPCPGWTLEDYDEAYILCYHVSDKDGGHRWTRLRGPSPEFELESAEDDALALLRAFTGEIFIHELPGYTDWFWREDDPIALFHQWEVAGLIECTKLRGKLRPAKPEWCELQ